MSDSERKIFPVETVLALVAGKKDADVKEIAGYIVGRSLKCDTLAHGTAVFAAAWLARLYPKFADLVWDEKEPWEHFVSRAAGVLGDRISLPPMDGRIKDACCGVIDAMIDKHAQIDALRAEVAKQTAEAEALKPLEGKLADARKQLGKLEDQLKAQKKDMGGLRKQVAEFQGKMPVDQEELLDMIKNAIKDNLKNITVAAGVAGAAGAAAGAAAAEGGEAPAGEAAAESAPSEDFGFGFGGGSGGDEFGF